MIASEVHPIAKAEYETLTTLRSSIRQLMHVTDDEARALGLSPQQHQLLLAIKGRPGRDWATASELAQALLLRHNSVVGLIDRAARLGLVYRQPHPEDGRLVQVHLTAAGEQMLAQLGRAHRAELQRLTSELLVKLQQLQE